MHPKIRRDFARLGRIDQASASADRPRGWPSWRLPARPQRDLRAHDGPAVNRLARFGAHGSAITAALVMWKLLNINVRCDLTIIVGRAFTERRTGPGNRCGLCQGVRILPPPDPASSEARMNYRGIEYSIVQGLGRNVWKWSASVAGVAISGQEPIKKAAVAAAERAIDRELAPKKLRLVPPEREQ
jgi:hypothetical protein